MFDAAKADFLAFPDFLKATPSEEGGARFIYLEASNEARDYQGETVLAKALAESAPYYLQFGNIDLDHVTQIGAARGIKEYPLFEIGRPIDVTAEPGRVFVKGQIFQGDGPTARSANIFWDSLQLTPPQRWYPSVGGAIPKEGREQVTDPDTGETRTIIKSVRWTNVGMSKTPVNLAVPSVSTVPFGALAKCWGPLGLDLQKALEAGYGTDSATLTGGGALDTQSLDGAVQSYWDLRDRLAADIRKKRVTPTADALTRHAIAAYRIGPAEASAWVERFLTGLKADLNKRKTK